MLLRVARPSCQQQAAARRQSQASALRARARARAAGAASPAAAAGGASARPGDEFFTAADSRPVVLFDGDCRLCNGGVAAVLALDPSTPGRVRLAAMQSPAGVKLLARAGRAEGDLSSVVLVTQEDSFVRSEAVLGIGEILDAPLPLPLAAAATRNLLPLPLRDAAYNLIAGTRYDIFGRSDVCRLDGGETDAERARFLSD